MKQVGRMRVYIARQPIVDRQRTLHGYELLYRGNETNAYDAHLDGSAATRALVSDAINIFGLDNLVGSRSAFVNFTRSLLISDYPLLLPSEHFVVEVLEDTTADAALLEHLKQFKAKGYTLALDDFMGERNKDAIMEYIDIIKVDFRLTNPATQRRIAQRYADKRLLAEKVETEEEFLRAREDGYALFQGYYFSKPLICSQSRRNIASITYVRLWEEITRQNPSFDRLEDIIRSDVSLAYRFIQRINTMEYYGGHRIGSLKHALVRMGIGELRRWILLILLRDSTGAQSDEFARTALVRGMFAEQLAPLLGLEDCSEQAYALGLFSVLEPEELHAMGQEDPQLSELYGGSGDYEQRFSELLNFLQRYEQGDWESVDAFVEEHSLTRQVVTTKYLECLRHADELFSSTQFTPGKDQTLPLG